MEESKIKRLKEIEKSYEALIKEVVDDILIKSENYGAALKEASKLLWYTNSHDFVEKLNNEINKRMELEVPSKRD
ncbi:hypothetical protein QVA73_05375 [Staphylococcus chromogenes]|uniref:hypothetical protein n=1 Tax=Staphylococcus chromogenes TaxID=46126 RepID=UPI002901A23C|nr:hypothetical protein [Staphylococcus chromogenes]MDU0476319.1 hypothetical protein [Staphylococcus chromogenes]